MASPDGPEAAACAVSVYASRETPAVLAATVHHLLLAAGFDPAGGGTVIDVMVNGNPAAARALAADAAVQQAVQAAPPGTRLRVWDVALADKAGAWNAYVHQVAPPARSFVFADGYVRVALPALASLQHTLQRAPTALAATALPCHGWSARRVAAQIRSEGGLHGNLHALSAAAMAELQRSGFRLPVGLYRTDSTLGAALSFGLNLGAREWRPRERIAVDEGAHYVVTPLRWWRARDLQTWLRRRSRQARGALENAAVRQRYAMRGLPFEQLPATAAELLQQWLADAPAEAAALLGRSRAARHALRASAAALPLLRAGGAAAAVCVSDQSAAALRQAGR